MATSASGTSVISTTAPTTGATTGIGSLPHHNIDSALTFSFRHGIPFLPQIPIRNPWEYMIAQALEDLPGLQIERDGEAKLNLGIWTSRAKALNERLDLAFRSARENPDAFESFEPSPATSSSWQSFLWELQERGCKQAKIQIAGPLTAQWALRLTDGSSLEKHPDVSSQIFKLVLARALAMTRRMQATGISPILFLDEPGLYAYTPSNPKHVASFQELKLMVQTLRKERVAVGLHCCSNTHWAAVLGMDLSYLSLDTALSLDHLLQTSWTEFVNFLKRGGRVAFGVIPTGRSSALRSLNAHDLFKELRDKLMISLGDENLVEAIFQQALYTPACGLALQSIPDAELISDTLNEFVQYAQPT
jgi:hypothetical protein